MIVDRMLVIDAANVVGSRPNGWWRDRAGAAATLCRHVAEAIESGEVDAPVVIVLEGAARRGFDESDDAGLRVVHAPGSGDDRIVDVVAEARADGHPVTVVSADRELGARARRLGADVVRPHWLLERV